MILTARNDVLSSRHAETRIDAVLCVLMANVGLQAAGGLVVPKPDRAVVCG